MSFRMQDSSGIEPEHVFGTVVKERERKLGEGERNDFPRDQESRESENTLNCFEFGR